MGVSPDKKAVFCQLSIYTKISTPPRLACVRVLRL